MLIAAAPTGAPLTDEAPYRPKARRAAAPDLKGRVITYVATPEPLTKRQRRRLRGKNKERG